jgi:hypothetical protein
VNILRTAAGILNEQKSVLEHLGKSRKFLETLLQFGTPLSEVSFHESEIMVSETSTMKAGTHDKGGTWLCECTLQGKTNKCGCNLESKHLKQHLEAHEQFNKSILDLIESIASTLGYVQDVEQFARLRELKRAIKDMEPLVEDTTKFIEGYASRGELGMPTPSTYDALVI